MRLTNLKAVANGRKVIRAWSIPEMVDVDVGKYQSDDPLMSENIRRDVLV
jgi:hypothetical protein